MYLTYGLIAGFGVGMGDITPVAVITKWFPDKRGLGTGMVVMGFGLGALFYNLIVKSVSSFRAAASVASDYAARRAQAHSPQSGMDATQRMATQHVDAVLNVIACSGVAFLIIGACCALLLTDPQPRPMVRCVSSMPSDASSGARCRIESAAIALICRAFSSRQLCFCC